jgi:hypothetical protein
MLRAPPEAWETAAMSAVLDVSKPTPLRLFGFLFTAVGGLLIALGAISDWGTVVFFGRFPDSATPGIDLPEGQVALGLGVLLLVAIVAMRIVSTTGARRALALAICLAAALALGIGVADVVRADERFGGFAVEQTAQKIADASGVPLEKVLRDVRAEIDTNGSIDLGLGLWLVVAGGALGLVGGLLDLAWVGEQRLREAESGADSSQ